MRNQGRSFPNFKRNFLAFAQCGQSSRIKTSSSFSLMNVCFVSSAAFDDHKTSSKVIKKHITNMMEKYLQSRSITFALIILFMIKKILST